MADPMMDLFDDPNLFNLDPLPDDTFTQSSSDPIDDALRLAFGHVATPPQHGAQASQPQQAVQTTQPYLSLHDYSGQKKQAVLQAPSATTAVAATTSKDPTLLGASVAVPVSTSTLTTVVRMPSAGLKTIAASSNQAHSQTVPKIVILKAPATSGAVTSQGQIHMVTTSSAGNNGGKVMLGKVLTGTPLRPGVSIVSGGTVLTTAAAGNAKGSLVNAGVGGAGVQRVVQTSNGPVKQVLLQTVQTQQQQLQPGQVQGSSATLKAPGITLTSIPQGESKRITLVLQQPQQGGSVSGLAGGQRFILGGLPGKIVLQGNQLAALTQARNSAQGGAGTGGQPKVVTIQLQVQQQPNCNTKLQLVSPSGGQQQVLQFSQGQVQGQRLAVPLKLLLQPQAGSSQGSVSVVKVSNMSEAQSSAGDQSPTPCPARGPETRRLEHQRKQEKANRIVAEAIARAKARGEQNIPRVLNQDELPTLAAGGAAAAGPGGEDGAGEEGAAGKKRSSKKKSAGAASGTAREEGKPAAKKSKSAGSSGGAGQGSKAKGKVKANTITPVAGKKRKRIGSSDNSDGELTPPTSPRGEEDESAKRRSNRQVKRRKYTEDLDIKITDDEEEEEDVDVTGPVKQEPITEPQAEGGDGVPTMQFFVEDPNEEDATIVDKILSMRLTKKEICQGQYTTVEEFFVKYKNYSYLHCEWASLEQLERDKRINQKLKRFKTKVAQMRHLFHEDEDPFNPDYVEVDRILDESHSVDKDNGEPVIYYLVKWCSLPYEDSTWELQEDVDQGKVEEFRKIQGRQPNLKRVPRPAASAWKKLELSREYKHGNCLREYQLEGVNWLLFNWYNKQNCILADEMGLGKTIQSISLLQEVYSAGLHGPFLIIAPLSTIANWEREFQTWTDMNTIVYHGSLASRQMIQQYEMYCKDDKGHLIPGAYKFEALITTFEMVLSDCPELREIEWRCVIIDEAHRLKNRNCKLLDSLKHLDLEHKVLLTGTPLQNTVEELFSLLNFLEPSQFPSETEFLKDFGDLKTEEQVQKLQALLKPMMLRRLKEDVEKKLVPKQETIIEVELTNIQKKYYRAILERNFSFLSKGPGQSNNVPNLLNTMMELRKCCNHPYLITGAEEKILSDLREVYDPLALDFHLQAMVRSAGKLVLIDKLLPKLKAGGHKVLIFSQMVRCLDILEDYLIHKRYLYERIDGRVRGNLRQAAIDRFSKPDSDRFVFLLCTRAGGLGINLTAADTCIIFDSDWNPQNDLQAQARCHRIGQSKAVKVYRLITRNSYERDMFDKASLKLGLDKAVLQSMSGKENNANGIQQFSKKEIEDLLRKGAYAAVMDEEDEGSKFCEEDIDQILQRRATTITIESEGKGSTFAKASFVASENRTDISLDDPNFWQKWAKKADLDMDTINRKNTLVIDTPRVRKQTRQFSTLKDDDPVEFSDLDSEEERPRSRRHERHHGYGRTDCFRVEKHLLVYGWGRWQDILSHGRFKRRLSERDVETICRTVLVYCLLHYRGDENIKGFIWDLITPSESGQAKELQNHSGLSIPVPRGRKGKKVKAQSTFDVHKAEWIRQYNPDSLFMDDSYKKHLKHQCNKVLLRVRMLYYLKQEVIGDQAEKVLGGADARQIGIWFPEVDQLELPARWWDAEADKSLLIGVFKHGYEKYNTMRADPSLCFVERVGRPDEKAIETEQRGGDNFGDLGEGGDFDKYTEDPEYKPMQGMSKEQDEEGDSMMLDEEISVVDGDEGHMAQAGAVYWPAGSALTARLRRLITAYQRSYRREQLKMEAAEKGDRRRRRCEAAYKLKEIARRERQQRWTRREECDFYRVVSTFGVEFSPAHGHFDWRRFRSFARLDKKTDDSLVRYYHGFLAMCRRVCKLPQPPGQVPPDPSLSIALITEERASRTLYRIDLLRKIREQLLPHPSLDQLLASLAQPSPELPDWWQSPQHDKELLLGAAKHGVSRTDQSILPDPEYSFHQARLAYLQQHQLQSRSSTPLNQLQQLQQSSNPASPFQDTPSSGWGLECEKDSKGEGLAQEVLRSGSEGSYPDSSAVFSGMSGNSTPLLLPPRSLFQKERDGKRRDDSDSDTDSDKEDCSSSTSSNNSGSSDESDTEKEVKTGREPKLFDPDEDGSVPSQDGFASEAGPERTVLEMLQDKQRASEWPKDRVLINRLDMLCSAVLTGRWLASRRVTPELGSPCLDEPRSSSPSPHSFTRLLPEDPEFTVRLRHEEGLKLTIQKQSLHHNGTLAEGSHQRGGRGRGAQADDPPQDSPFSDPQARVPVIHSLTRSVLVGQDAPLRSELSDWLKEHPQYEVEPQALSFLAGSHRHKKHRSKKVSKLEPGTLSGAERVQLVHLRSGRKLGGAFAPSLRGLRQCLEENPDYFVSADWAELVRHSGYLPDSMFDRILTQDIKKSSRRPKQTPRAHKHHGNSSRHNDSIIKLEPTALSSTGGLPLLPDSSSSGSYQTEGNRHPHYHRNSSSAPSPALPRHILSPAYGVKMETELEGGALEVIDCSDSLSQGYASSDKDLSLLDDPMMPNNSESSEGED
ncbi:chromodomain-helicase-DNA-binding protein 8 isoform X1 [Acipenser ruthenus]|uniref:chromodomain-helicase-DNA-binding protein 8 isoform X1 n=1 Tax=Acipenser ruthenus TaxID=7906 RepID=UPI0027422E83|nr:chromodomain-helicase-DNA-binding protein 8 isoform X1 [Acipenser ruthenus]XP_058868477.1 chromodomain-helicase-DNA-binding protein 8 isoform X1 [Acipenser ruthenus]